MDIRHLPAELVSLIGSIDRSEEVGVAYSVLDGELVSSEVNWTVLAWSPTGTGEHTVAHQISQRRPVLERGAMLLGAFEDRTFLGLSILEPRFENGLAWLAFLHVSRPYRRRGVATALWEEAALMAREAGAYKMYVSATRSASAVGFYLDRGCELAVPPHPDLFAHEPEDIHLTLTLASD